MSIGSTDYNDAVREGWLRDPDNEVSLDGYNAFIELDTNDGSGAFIVKDSSGENKFRSDSAGNTTVTNDLSVGNKTTTDKLAVTDGSQDGHILISDNTGNATWQPDPLADDVQDILNVLDGYVTSSSADTKVKVSANDTTAGTLIEKIVEGPGITLTEINNGGDEDLELSITPGILDGYGSGSLPAPTCCGQILFSLDTVSFTPELPLTSTTSGWLLNDSGNLLVVG